MEKKVKLKDAIELGKDCGLNTIEECIINVEVHAINFFPYKKINEELKELYEGYEEVKNSYDLKEFYEAV